MLGYKKLFTHAIIRYADPTILLDCLLLDNSVQQVCSIKITI